ncbi:MAG: SH3 domain-containing protein, partial [Lachnospiraceae bacterium]|nr:SH3 domain-containing protein [Lachnospiraceae bacterium]
MKKFDTLIQKSSWVKGLAGIAAAVMVIFASSFSCFAAEGKVKAETAKIRSQASTDSEVVGSTVKGKTIDILEAVKDGSGTVWYKVSVANGGFGYIRSDLVETSANIEVKAVTETAASSSGGSKPADTVPTAIGEQ